MIIYNMRERGSLEYDKFTHNIFQFCNYVNYYIQEINNQTFLNLVDDINCKYQEAEDIINEEYKRYIANEER